MVQGVKYPDYLNRLYQPEAGKEAFNHLYRVYTYYRIPADIAISVIKKKFFIGKGNTLLKEGINPQAYTNKYNLRYFWKEIREALKKK